MSNSDKNPHLVRDLLGTWLTQRRAARGKAEHEAIANENFVTRFMASIVQGQQQTRVSLTHDQRLVLAEQVRLRVAQLAKTEAELIKMRSDAVQGNLEGWI